MMQPGMFRYVFGGPGLPEWEVSSHDEKLMRSMIRRIKDGQAEVSLKPLHRLTPRCISMPVYGPYDAPSAVILATGREVAEKRLNEIQQGFVEIDMDLVFGRQR
ncbi:hypothetical protein N7516_010202 [Penicillium verrucosum]|uniref:uncharacterized protein n=1 Tax=Penicillium verrucosum TaxID=60171 RepID=UPI0025456D01|nr:uncharacterized protein N7516_010202 [Penicillium verrucosum]KAJ5922499.1 hypothetical protein N7516_010202 [Penicillium verrucosum]